MLTHSTPVRLGQTQQLPVSERSHLGACRRIAVSLAQELQFSEERCSDVAIVATEMATNILKHAGCGTILLQHRRDPDQIQLLATDQGPGMLNKTLCLEDGFSTVGTCGIGLGAIARLANAFDLYSVRNRGTVCAARLEPKRPSPDRPSQDARSWDYAAVNVPIDSESRCGDAWGVFPSADGLTCIVADGLGHGSLAADAAEAAIEAATLEPTAAPDQLLRNMHEATKGTRGAAVGVARIDPAEGTVTFAGIGNISAWIANGKQVQRMVSMNGIVGSTFPGVQTYSYSWCSSAVLVMHSDGLNSKSNLTTYRNWQRLNPMTLAGLLHRDYRRGRDDATVVVVREVSAA